MKYLVLQYKSNYEKSWITPRSNVVQKFGLGYWIEHISTHNNRFGRSLATWLWVIPTKFWRVFTKFMIHIHLYIKNKINMWALFWLDQNYRFFIAKLTVFWSHFSLPKNDQFCYKKICNFDQIKKGLTYWFCFWSINAYGS